MPQTYPNNALSAGGRRFQPQTEDKMTRDEEMWELYASGWRAVDLAMRYHLTVCRIYQILRQPEIHIRITTGRLKRPCPAQVCQNRERTSFGITVELDLVSEDDAEDWCDRLQSLIRSNIGFSREPIVEVVLLD